MNTYTPENKKKNHMSIFTYRLREVCDVGIGKHMWFCTEQHYKNKSNKIGILTLNCVRRSDACTEENVLVKCIDIHPVILLSVNRKYNKIQSYIDKMKSFLNKEIASSFAKFSNDKCITMLQDSRYVISVSSNEGQVQGLSTDIEIVFNRTEDIKMLMKSCRDFFKENENDAADIIVKFSPPEYPMWVRLHHDISDNILYKKYRDDFNNWEVCNEFCKREKWHHSSRFSVGGQAILHLSKIKTGDVWLPVIYTEYSKLDVVH